MKAWRIFVNSIALILVPIWVPIMFWAAFFFADEFKGARKGEGYLLNL